MGQIELKKSNHRKSLVETTRRILWALIWGMCASWTPRFMNTWRVLILRTFGAEIGRETLVFGSVRIDMPWNLTLGDFSAIGRRAWIYNFAKVSIGSNTVISQDTTLCTSTHDYEDPHMPLQSREIVIGSEAWVAADCFVLPGITIGDGAVVGARSLVTKDVAPWTVCAGHPCKFIKPRIILAAVNSQV